MPLSMVRRIETTDKDDKQQISIDEVSLPSSPSVSSRSKQRYYMYSSKPFIDKKFRFWYELLHSSFITVDSVILTPRFSLIYSWPVLVTQRVIRSTLSIALSVINFEHADCAAPLAILVFYPPRWTRPWGGAGKCMSVCLLSSPAH